MGKSKSNEEVTTDLKAHLVLEKNGLNFLGKTRMSLLEEIQRTGSISKAAKGLGMSYKTAWDAIDAINNLSEKAIVERNAGGVHGGGTTITEYGMELIQTFREIEREYQNNLYAKLINAKEACQRFTIKTSARNQFSGKISKIIKGKVNAEITIHIDDHLELIAIIPLSSLLNLGLKNGSIVIAFFGSSSVMISTENHLNISARNQFKGIVNRIEKGAVNSEITIDLGSHRTICAMFENDCMQNLQLKLGKDVNVLIKSSNIIIGVN
ncbi:MAG: TOBE domain-containing protein [Bacteriovoracaceae bacterium]